MGRCQRDARPPPTHQPAVIRWPLGEDSRGYGVPVSGGLCADIVKWVGKTDSTHLTGLDWK